MSRFIPDEYHCKSKWCELFNSVWNPLGNYIEPLPTPEKRKIQAEESWMPSWLWWALRNPFSNFCHFWIGITPVGHRYEWIEPQERGWIRMQLPPNGKWQKSYWTHPAKLITLPFYHFLADNYEFYIGWLDRGNFGIAFRSRS